MAGNRRRKQTPPGMLAALPAANERAKTDADNVLFSVPIIHFFPPSVHTHFATEDHHARTLAEVEQDALCKVFHALWDVHPAERTTAEVKHFLLDQEKRIAALEVAMMGVLDDC